MKHGQNFTGRFKDIETLILTRLGKLSPLGSTTYFSRGLGPGCCSLCEAVGRHLGKRSALSSQGDEDLMQRSGLRPAMNLIQILAEATGHSDQAWRTSPAEMGRSLLPHCFTHSCHDCHFFFSSELFSIKNVMFTVSGFSFSLCLWKLIEVFQSLEKLNACLAQVTGLGLGLLQSICHCPPWHPCL